MGTLSSELAPHVEKLTARPRIYADANVPAGIVAHMRVRLNWDVLFVLEHDDLRRAGGERSPDHQPDHHRDVAQPVELGHPITPVTHILDEREALQSLG